MLLQGERLVVPVLVVREPFEVEEIAFEVVLSEVPLLFLELQFASFLDHLIILVAFVETTSTVTMFGP